MQKLIQMPPSPAPDQQIDECLMTLRNIFSQDLLGVYLYGSSVLGGRQVYSDVDLFVILRRPSTLLEKEVLTKDLLKFSGLYMQGPRPPLEVTMVAESMVKPWHYPPAFDYQYGEWLRPDFERQNYTPWASMSMPDLALLIPQLLLAHRTLWGCTPAQLLEPVHYGNFISALGDGLADTFGNLAGDTRNVLLTLARIWSTLETDQIRPKPHAAQWVIPHLPRAYQPVLDRARLICLGNEKEHWEDLQDRLQPCAEYMLEKAQAVYLTIKNSDSSGRRITLARGAMD